MNWYKWIGIILLSLATASVGFWLAYRLDKRLEEYRQMQKILHILGSRMRMGENLAAAMESCIAAGAGSFQPWLAAMARRLQAREPLSKVWPEEFKKAKAGLHLENEDYQMLEGLGQSLSRSDLESCLGQISQVQDFFHAQQTGLEMAAAEQGRMYRSIGVLAAILVMVVLA